MEVYSPRIPLKRLWGSNFLLSAIFQITLCVIAISSGNLIFSVLSYFTSVLSVFVFLDWKYITLSLNLVGQVFSFFSSFYFCYSPKMAGLPFRFNWQRDSLKWLFPLVCIHSFFVSVTVISLKRKHNVKDKFPLNDVISLLTESDSYFEEKRKTREQSLKVKRLESEMRKKEIKKEEEVAKKIMDNLYSFTNRSNFPELETRNEMDLNDKTEENWKGLVRKEGVGELIQKSNLDDHQKYEGFNYKISIPDDLESVNSVKRPDENYIK